AVEDRPREHRVAGAIEPGGGVDPGAHPRPDRGHRPDHHGRAPPPPPRSPPNRSRCRSGHALLPSVASPDPIASGSPVGRARLPEIEEWVGPPGIRALPPGLLRSRTMPGGDRG